MKALRVALIAVVLSLRSIAAHAQPVYQLPRITPTTGLADSSLFLCSDSTKTLTRACKFSDVQKRLAFKTFDSLLVSGPTYFQTSPVTLGSVGGAFTLQGTTVASASDVASGALTFNANIGRGTGAVGGFVFAVPVTTSTGTTAQTLQNALAVKATTVLMVLAAGADVLPVAFTGTGTTSILQTGTVRLSGSAITAMTRVNGTLATPTIITTGQTLGTIRYQGAMSATTSYSAAEIRGVSTEGWINNTSGGTKQEFYVTPNTTGAVALALTLDQDKSAIFAARAKIADGTAALPSVTPTSDTTLGLYKFGTDTLGIASLGVNTLQISGGASANIVGGAGNMTITAGTGNSRTLSLNATNSSGTALTAALVTSAAVRPNSDAGTDLGTSTIRWGTVYSTLDWGENGSQTNPIYSFRNSTGTGMFRFGADTIGFANAGGQSLGISGGSGKTTLLGLGGGGITIQPVAGSGSAQTLTLRTSNSGGTVTTFASGSGDTLNFAGHAIAASFTAASGTPGTVCYNTATNEITKDNATTCVVSARRFKHDIAALSLADAKRIVMGLKPSTFTYNSGGRKSIGLVAEEADSVDSRLGFRNKDGTLNSVDYLALGPILVRVVQDQQRQIDSLRAALKPAKADVLAPGALALLIGVGAVAAGAALTRRKAA